MRHPGVTRGQFFEKLHDIFPPSIGSSNAEQEANMVEIAYQASCPRNDSPRVAGRKENFNPQNGKRKATIDEPSPEIKLLQDLKSENENMRALLTTIIDHLGISAGKKGSR
jgi:hypothetical protein